MRSAMLAMCLAAAIVACGVQAASAHEFLASTLGLGLMKALNTQVITTEEGKIECNEADTPTEVLALKDTVLDPHLLTYSECTAFTIVGVEVSTAAYEFYANGLFALEKPFTVKIPTIGCTVTFGAQSKLNSVLYANKGGEIELKLEVGGLKYEAAGGCTKNGKFSTGTYTGKLTTGVKGGTMEWI